MESPSEYFRRNVDKHRETLVLLGHPVKMTPAKREETIRKLVARGDSRELAEKKVAFETGETNGDVIASSEPE